jgi:predicted alpha/beta-hydrolase family hydrolase
MTSQAQADSGLPGVQALVFLGFPLHPAKRPSTERAQHLVGVSVPMLFIQGTRDELAEFSLLRSVCDQLGTQATLHLIQDADHSFHVRVKSGRTDAEVRQEIAGAIALWSPCLT